MFRGFRRRRMLAAVVPVLAAAVVVGTAIGGSTAAVAGGTINVGNVSAVTGPIALPDSSEGAAAFFKRLDKTGGINGTRVNFIVTDDKTDPATSATDARQLIQQNHVVAMVGSLSLVDCAVNEQLYELNNVRGIIVGSIPQCFTSKNIAAANTGPEIDEINQLVWAYKSLHAKAICLFLTNSPLINPEHPVELAAFKQITGQSPAVSDDTLTPNSNYATFMAEAQQHSCDAILTDGNSAQAAPMVQAERNAGLNIPMVFAGAEYINSLPAAIGKGATPVYTVSEMIPFTEKNAQLTQMYADMKAAGVAVNSLSEYGWECANLFTQIAKTIKGPITLASVNKALLATTNLNTNGFTGTPFAFGPGKAHNPNRGGKMMEIKNGKWVEVSGWINLKPGITG